MDNGYSYALRCMEAAMRAGIPFEFSFDEDGGPRMAVKGEHRDRFNAILEGIIASCPSTSSSKPKN